VSVGRIGCIGFGGPPAHIALLRGLCVEERQWMPPEDYRGRAGRLQTCCLARPRPSWPSSVPGGSAGPPGPSSAGSAIIVPGLVIIPRSRALFLAPVRWAGFAGAAAGAGAGQCPLVAVAAAAGLTARPSWRKGTVRS